MATSQKHHTILKTLKRCGLKQKQRSKALKYSHIVMVAITLKYKASFIRYCLCGLKDMTSDSDTNCAFPQPLSFLIW